MAENAQDFVKRIKRQFPPFLPDDPKGLQRVCKTMAQALEKTLDYITYQRKA